MPIDQIDVRNVMIDSRGNTIRTLIMGDPTLPKLVLVHGYGGSGVLLYKIFKDLSQHFNLIVIDLLGMGSSSRPPFECDTCDQADTYCMDFLENWRLAMDISQFIMVGHSYGSYLSGTYASIYPQHIKKLILLSPLGLKFKPQNFKMENVRLQEGKAPPKCALQIQKMLWGKFTPFSLYRGRGMSEKGVIKSLTGYVRKH